MQRYKQNTTKAIAKVLKKNIDLLTLFSCFYPKFSVTLYGAPFLNVNES